MKNWLNGNGTNLGLLAGGLLGILWNHGVIDDLWAGTLASAITTWTGVRIRHAYKKGK